MKVVLLDLDGTLTQSHAGIIACAKKAMSDLGMQIPDDTEMLRFVGPSILESFQRNHMPKELQSEGVKLYRKYYSEVATFIDPNNPNGDMITGNFLNKVYDGIPEQLKLLRKSGYYLATASCKPEYQVKPICDHFGLTNLIDGIYGASKDMSRINKDQVIRYVFENIGFNPLRDRALMVGDRWTDVDGALACNIDCLGCSWGYAEPGELKAHGAYRIIDSVSDLNNAINEYFE
ncbi:HAD hydrolase-like protein [Gardnerella vaginalis]|jgi:possible 5'-nucleotidase|uniref:Haloacid dehalogenase-like hydrolase n=1 Tax=Gardnerella vaginalis JCP8108 TaxID=1261066 RepID=S4GST8_GARVA|nr:HAD hydrolase-like protein [Gardnerella vaginalis]EPI49473.1 haloacid dehalogenase-like hydrolase [Gardnerella vaginalis JCP8108]